MSWFNAKVVEPTAKKKERVAELTIDRAIGSDWAPDWVNDLTGELPARDFINAVEALGEVDKIRLSINSPGGDVASGVRIYNYLKNHSAKVEIRVDGMAASIASVIMQAGDSRVMGVGSTVMIHNPMTYANGFYNEIELREMADAMSVIKAAIVDAYVAGTGQSAEQISEMLDQGDTYFDAAQAIESGFATATDEKLRAVATADLKVYAAQIEIAAKAKHFEEMNNKLALENVEIIEKLNAAENRASELEAMVNVNLETIDGLEDYVAQLTSPKAKATADDVIAKTSELGLEHYAINIVKQEIAADELDSHLANLSDLVDIAAAAGVDPLAMVQNFDNPIALVRAALTEAKAETQVDVDSHVSPAEGKSKAPDYRRAYSQLNRK